MLVVAAYCCQALFKAEKAFFAKIQKHSKVLKAADKRSRKMRRGAVH